MGARLEAFLPEHLRAGLLRREPGAPPWEERFAGALLLSDISGFTALTERLQAEGRQGAETVARVVNAAFLPAIRAVEREGGSIASFGGDALFSVFPGRGAAARAMVAARRIGTAFLRPVAAPGVEPLSLALKQALHVGTVRGLHLGRPERRIYLTTGPAVRHLANLGGAARDGDVLVSPAARRAMGNAARWVRPRGARRLPDAAAARYLAPEVVPLLPGFEGGFRRVAAMFVETRGTRREGLQTFCVALLSVLEEHGGLLHETDLSPHGVKWFCLFGMPVAHEDDEERAAHAFLELRRRVGGAIPVRAGLHAGVVVALRLGTPGRSNLSAMGDTVNTAARAQARAAWGEALATGSMTRMLRRVATAARGSHRVKGKTGALQLASVEGTRRGPEIQGGSRLVGRDREMRTLVAALEEAAAGRGAVLGIQGDAGVGKSRLKWEISRVARDMGFVVHEGRSTAFGGRPLEPVRELVAGVLAAAEGDDAREEPSTGLAARCEALGIDAVDRDHLAGILGMPAPAEGAAGPDDARALRLNNVLAVRRLLTASARETPRLLVLEDMHWADELTREVVEHLHRHAGTAPFLGLTLARPGYRAPGTEIQLAELPADAVADMLAGLLAAAPGPVAELVCERAGGNPLFVEQLVRHLMDTGTVVERDGALHVARAFQADDVPPTLQSLLEARLDRLSPAARRVAQVASVLGRTFRTDHLGMVGEAGGAAEAALAELELRSLVFPLPAPGPASRTFKHALVRDAAYATILTTRRRELHRRAAAGLEALPGTPAALLGHHWEQAGDPGRAWRSYLEAARAAAAGHALGEAEAHYASALRLAGGDDAEAVAAGDELAQRVLLIDGRLAEGLEAQERALAMARRLGHGPSIARALHGKARLLFRQSDQDAALGLAREALAIHRGCGDRAGEGRSLNTLGTLLMSRGDVAEADRVLRQAVALQESLQDHPGLGLTLANLAIREQRRGNTAEAIGLLRRAGDIHDAAGQPRLKAISLLNLGTMLQSTGDRDAALASYDAAVSLVWRVGDRMLEAMTLVNAATVLNERGRLGEAEARLHEALALARDVGSVHAERMALANLAAVALRRGRIEEAESHARAAVALFRDQKEWRTEALTLVNLASVLRLTPTGIEEAERAARHGVEMLSQLDDAFNVPLCLCELGHALLAAGRDARGTLAEAEAAAGRLGERRNAAHVERLEGLRAAITARDAGEELVGGQRAADQAPELVAALRARRDGR